MTGAFVTAIACLIGILINFLDQTCWIALPIGVYAVCLLGATADVESEDQE